MVITKDFIPVGRYNRPGGSYKKTSITIHNTGNKSKGAGAKAHANYIKNPSTRTSWHYTVGADGIYQHLPDEEMAYHAGKTEGNKHSIGVEICMDAGADLRKATDDAVKLVASLCNTHGLGVKDIKKHRDWTGKNCPSEILAGRPYSWDKFIEKVRVELDALKQPVGLYKVQVGAFSKEANAKALVERLRASGFDGFIVKQ